MSTYAPISFVAVNYRDYKNWWLKAYEPSTTTPKAISLDSEGTTLVAKLELNKDGFPVSAGQALVIPHISGYYDLWLFPTEATADANDTSNALRVADDMLAIGIGGTISSTIETLDLADGQDAVTFSANVRGAGFVLNGDNVDSGRLLVDLDFTFGTNPTDIILTNTYPLGTSISALKADFGGDTGNDKVIAFETLASAQQYPQAKKFMVFNIKERTTGNGGGAIWDCVDINSVSVNGFDIVACDNVDLALKLRISAKFGVSLAELGVTSTAIDNHLRVGLASDIAVSLGTFINPDQTGVCKFIGETPTISAPIACDRPIRQAVFEQTDNSKSVLIFASGVDFFHAHNFWCRFTDHEGVQTAPAIHLLGDNHNTKFSNIHTLGGTYGIHADNVAWFQTYEMCRFDNYKLAQMRFDGPSTTININNCGGYSDTTTITSIADSALIFTGGTGEVNINTYETGQGRMKSLINADSVFNLEMTAIHWENSEVTVTAFNLSNCSASLRGLYMQKAKVLAGVTAPLVTAFKSTMQIANITNREFTPDGALTLLSGSLAGTLNNSDTVLELSGSIDLTDFTVSGDYRDYNGVSQPIGSAQVMLVDAPKVKIFSVSNVAPNTNIALPFNGSKPSFMQVVLGGSTRGVTDTFDGTFAVPTEVTGGNLTSNATFRYRWVNADGTLGVGNKDIQVICHYPTGWYALN